MKFLLHMVAPTMALAALIAQSAFGQVRIATIDMTKTFDSYWRTKQLDALLKEQAAEMDKELRGFIEERTKAAEDYQKALAAANDPTLSAEERDKRRAEADKKLQDLRELEKNIQDYDRQARVILDEKRNRYRANLVDEIRAVIEARAKSAGYTLVLDSSAVGANNVPVVLYRAAENDLTEEVIKQLNATAPADFNKPAEPKQEPPKEQRPRGR
ncbi:MAG: OmpH family outer membrane protein [Verrucomicrobiae bacterium]|nr:OmpH family outer membrane protein [Verrucomicrobiae bacterium]MCX7722786.1 OmpH family outer membrane protein [Verrucomicrobiae bacterium]MDW7980996.1 OmpH family outer membrane protein [Verrucomicrobiales bacterium]